MVDILHGFQRYCTTRYSEFKNDIKSYLKKHGELTQPSSILAEHWSKYIEDCKDPYVQVLACTQAKQAYTSKHDP